MTEDSSLEQHIENMKKITEKILSLPESFSLPNGWLLRELLLHLWSWDEEYIRLSEAKIQGTADDFQFEFQKLDMDYVKWNDVVLEKMSDLSFDQAKQKFITSRKKLISLFEKILTLPDDYQEADPKDFRRTDRLVTLWYHDKTHLEAGGIQIDF